MNKVSDFKFQETWSLAADVFAKAAKENTIMNESRHNPKI